MFFPKQLLSLATISALLTLASAQARVGCSRFAVVHTDDTCNIVSKQYGVSTFQLVNANPFVRPKLNCDRLFPRQPLCLGLEGKDCTTVVEAQDGDTCEGIADAAGIPVDTLIANNPNVKSNCDNDENIPQGIYLCTDSQIFDYSD